MKTAKRRFFLLFFSVLFGLMMGVQMMSEYAGLNEPKPLNIETTIEDEGAESMQAVSVPPEEKEEKRQPITTNREEKGLSNLFSDLGSTLANQTEGATRSGLEKVVSLVQDNVNKEERE
ncbi:hypothetical protein ACE1TH_08180 [Shouchella sp. JSM 1781072]|uniref:hypothetical protein n=1 Tax=Shouchella sp. JSM 1781072 TaxID=3344581 RepID=UPI0035BF7E1D